MSDTYTDAKTTAVNPHPTDVAVSRAADAAGITSPSQLGETEMASPQMLHLRVQSLEAIVAHLISTHFRGMDREAVVAQWLKDVAGGEVLNEHVQGAPGPLKPKNTPGL